MVSARQIYLDRIGPTLVKEKKVAFEKTWHEVIYPQLIKHKLPIPNEKYLNQYRQTNSILDFPINQRIQRVELELMLHLDLVPEIEYEIGKYANDIFTAAYPSNIVNASVTKCSPTSYLILLNEGFINFSQAVTTWCIYLFEKIQENNTYDDLEDDLFWIREKVRFYFQGYRDNLELIENYEIQPTLEELTLIRKITDYALKFAIAHELGHIHNGDLLNGVFSKKSFSDVELDEYVKNKEKEFDADNFAFDLLTKINNEYYEKEELEFVICGILLFFWVGDIMEYIYSLDEDNFSKTHPKIVLRAYKIMERIEKEYSEYLELAFLFEELFSIIFEGDIDE